MEMVLVNGMKTNSVPIDRAGRIVLPKEIRQELSIKAGDTFKISIDGAGVTLIPNKEASGFVRKGKAFVFSTPGDQTLSEETVQEILNAGRAERDAHILEGLYDGKHKG